jgi:hypothetical protein
VSGGFFGFGVIPQGVVLGSVLGGGGFFGPNFKKKAVSNPPVSVIGGNSSTGPFVSPPNPSNVSIAAATSFAPSGSNVGLLTPDPYNINGHKLVVIGQVQVVSDSSNWFVVAILGAGLAQNFFTALDFTDNSANHYHLTTATAVAFNTHFTDPSLSIWEWQPVPTANLGFPAVNVTFT